MVGFLLFTGTRLLTRWDANSSPYAMEKDKFPKCLDDYFKISASKLLSDTPGLAWAKK